MVMVRLSAEAIASIVSDTKGEQMDKFVCACGAALAKHNKVAKVLRVVAVDSVSAVVEAVILNPKVNAEKLREHVEAVLRFAIQDSSNEVRDAARKLFKEYASLYEAESVDRFTTSLSPHLQKSLVPKPLPPSHSTKPAPPNRSKSLLPISPANHTQSHLPRAQTLPAHVYPHHRVVTHRESIDDRLFASLSHGDSSVDFETLPESAAGLWFDEDEFDGSVMEEEEEEEEQSSSMGFVATAVASNESKYTQLEPTPPPPPSQPSRPATLAIPSIRRRKSSILPLVPLPPSLQSHRSSESTPSTTPSLDSEPAPVVDLNVVYTFTLEQEVAAAEEAAAYRRRTRLVGVGLGEAEGEGEEEVELDPDFLWDVDGSGEDASGSELNEEGATAMTTAGGSGNVVMKGEEEMRKGSEEGSVEVAGLEVPVDQGVSGNESLCNESTPLAPAATVTESDPAKTTAAVVEDLVVVPLEEPVVETESPVVFANEDARADTFDSILLPQVDRVPLEMQNSIPPRVEATQIGLDEEAADFESIDVLSDQGTAYEPVLMVSDSVEGGVKGEEDVVQLCVGLEGGEGVETMRVVVLEEVLLGEAVRGDGSERESEEAVVDAVEAEVDLGSPENQDASTKLEVAVPVSSDSENLLKPTQEPIEMIMESIALDPAAVIHPNKDAIAPAVEPLLSPSPDFPPEPTPRPTTTTKPRFSFLPTSRGAKPTPSPPSDSTISPPQRHSMLASPNSITSPTLQRQSMTSLPTSSLLVLPRQTSLPRPLSLSSKLPNAVSRGVLGQPRVSTSVQESLTSNSKTIPKQSTPTPTRTASPSPSNSSSTSNRSLSPLGTTTTSSSKRATTKPTTRVHPPSHPVPVPARSNSRIHRSNSDPPVPPLRSTSSLSRAPPSPTPPPPMRFSYSKSPPPAASLRALSPLGGRGRSSTPTTTASIKRASTLPTMQQRRAVSVLGTRGSVAPPPVAGKGVVIGVQKPTGTAFGRSAVTSPIPPVVAARAVKKVAVVEPIVVVACVPEESGKRVSWNPDLATVLGVSVCDQYAVQVREAVEEALVGGVFALWEFVDSFEAGGGSLWREEAGREKVGEVVGVVVGELKGCQDSVKVKRGLAVLRSILEVVPAMQVEELEEGEEVNKVWVTVDQWMQVLECVLNLAAEAEGTDVTLPIVDRLEIEYEVSNTLETFESRVSFISVCEILCGVLGRVAGGGGGEGGGGHRAVAVQRAGFEMLARALDSQGAGCELEGVEWGELTGHVVEALESKHPLTRKAGFDSAVALCRCRGSTRELYDLVLEKSGKSRMTVLKGMMERRLR
ncbi:hypothetical protein HDU98_007957 [Podochytrium sp. JEL0797]|nr:hypothetical protein HDU98_007957 [Podochytrium sp. JEL0797]